MILGLGQIVKELKNGKFIIVRDIKEESCQIRQKAIVTSQRPSGPVTTTSSNVWMKRDHE